MIGSLHSAALNIAALNVAALKITEPWSIVFAVGLFAYIALRHHHEGLVKVATAGETSRERRLDAIEATLLIIVMLGCVLVPLLYLFTPWFDAFEDSVTGFERPVAMQAFGTVVMVGSLYLFHRSHVDLGKQWSVTLEIRADHRLVEEGVYRRVRHPMYAAVWGFGIAQALILPNLASGLAGVFAIAPLYFVRTPREEKLMRETFGAEYDDYSARTGRLLPRLRPRARDPR